MRRKKSDNYILMSSNRCMPVSDSVARGGARKACAEGTVTQAGHQTNTKICLGSFGLNSVPLTECSILGSLLRKSGGFVRL